MAWVFSTLHITAMFCPYGLMSGANATLKGVSEHIQQLLPATDFIFGKHMRVLDCFTAHALTYFYAVVSQSLPLSEEEAQAYDINSK